MATSTDARGISRFFLPLAVVALTGLLLFAFFRRTAGEESTDDGPHDGLTYEQRVAPLVAESATIAARLSATNSPLADTLQAATQLRSRWQEARTARGYERARHDGFILTFNQFFNALQSVDTISAALSTNPGPDGGIAETRKMETLFALQSVHGAETGAQLVSKTRMGLTTGRTWAEFFRLFRPAQP